MIITSKHNPKIKHLINLRKRRERHKAKVTLVDGFEEVKNALLSDVQVIELYYCPELMGDDEQTQRLSQLLSTGTDAHELSRDVFEKVAYSESPDGWLAVVPAIRSRLEDIKLGINPLILICEAVEKPGNLGAMIRTANAAGVDAVISVNGVTDWDNPNLIRASRGAVFSTQVADCDSGEELLKWLRTHHIKAVATTLEGSVDYTEADLKRGVAIVMGAEHQGLTDFWLNGAEVKVRIPMTGHLDSLNVSVAAGILLYEAVRQRLEKLMPAK